MMVGRLVDWFRKWFVTVDRYRSALEDQRWCLEKLSIAIDKEQDDSEHWNEELEKEKTWSRQLTQALDDERTRFEKELLASHKELQELSETNKQQKVENDLLELANDGLMKINAALHSQVEMIEGESTAKKIQNLNEQNKNPLQGLL